jgi:hypothetical protein
MADLLLNAPIQYEPHQVQRWVLRFPDDIAIQPFQLVKCDFPKPTNAPIAMGFINTETFVKGKTKWSAISVTLRDFIAPSTMQALMEWQRLHHEAVTGRDGYAVGYKKTLYLERLDPTGVVVSRWRLEHCMIANEINSSQGDYSSDGVVEITFSVQPDRCILEY